MRTTLKLNQIVDEWIIETDVSLETQRDYRRKIELWFRWLSAQGIDPRTPLREHILQYKHHLQGQGKSKFTYFSYVTVVKLFYRYCAGQNYYDNIGSGIHASIKHRAHYKNPLSSADAYRLMDSIDTSTLVGKRDKLIIALMLTNGLRTCEVQRINICDFEKMGERTVLHIQRKGRLDKNDILAVPEIIEELFEEYISCRSFNIDDPLVLNHRKGQKATRLSKQAISQIIKERLRSIGIDDPKITAHSLRHTCGSLLVEQGLDIEMIKDLLGHTNTATTRIYIEQAQRRRLIEQNPGAIIAELISKPKKK